MAPSTVPGALDASDSLSPGLRRQWAGVGGAQDTDDGPGGKRSPHSPGPEERAARVRRRKTAGNRLDVQGKVQSHPRVQGTACGEGTQGRVGRVRELRWTARQEERGRLSSEGVPKSAKAEFPGPGIRHPQAHLEAASLQDSRRSLSPPASPARHRPSVPSHPRENLGRQGLVLHQGKAGSASEPQARAPVCMSVMRTGHGSIRTIGMMSAKDLVACLCQGGTSTLS
eukprot:XP_016876374.1 uncharacterized protein LOC105370295 [Homo sapiens]